MQHRRSLRLALLSFSAVVVVGLLGAAAVMGLNRFIPDHSADPIAVVRRDAGFRLDPPGAHAAPYDQTQMCDSGQLEVSRQFLFDAPRAAVLRFYAEQLPIRGWKGSTPQAGDIGVTYHKAIDGYLDVSLNVRTTPDAFLVEAWGNANC